MPASTTAFYLSTRKNDLLNDIGIAPAEELSRQARRERLVKQQAPEILDEAAESWRLPPNAL